MGHAYIRPGFGYLMKQLVIRFRNGFSAFGARCRYAPQKWISLGPMCLRALVAMPVPPHFVSYVQVGITIYEYYQFMHIGLSPPPPPPRLAVLFTPYPEANTDPDPNPKLLGYCRPPIFPNFDVFLGV